MFATGTQRNAYIFSVGVELIFGFGMTLFSLKLAKLLQLPVSSAMMDIWQTVVSRAVGQGRVHSAIFELKSSQSYFGFGTTSVSVTIGNLFVLPVFDRHLRY